MNDFRKKKQRMAKKPRGSLKQWVDDGVTTGIVEGRLGKDFQFTKEFFDVGPRPVKVRTEFDAEDLKALVSDVIGLDMDNTHRSVFSICSSLCEKLKANGIPRYEAESMAIGAEVLLEDIIENVRRLS